MAATGACLIEVRSSHSAPASPPSACAMQDSITATVRRIGTLKTSTSTWRASSAGVGEPGSAMSLPRTCSPIRRSRKRASQRP